jgi:hypothetical protein
MHFHANKQTGVFEYNWVLFRNNCFGSVEVFETEYFLTTLYKRRQCEG